MAMSDTEFVFTLLFLLLALACIYPPAEFVGAGLTISQLFSSYLVDESIDFVRHHIKRVNLTLMIHSLLPQLYIIFIQFASDPDDDDDDVAEAIPSLPWICFRLFAALQPILAFGIIYYWHLNDWRAHPIVRCLAKFSGEQMSDWRAVAESVNTEYRRTDKVEFAANNITKVIATENWIIKTHLYTVYFAHQSDTALIIDKADTIDVQQFINMQVKSVRPGVRHFSIRFKADNFLLLKDRINGRIEILSSAKFHTSLVDHFVEVFQEQVAKNPKIRQNVNLDSCFACMVAQPNIKLTKNCTDVDANDRPLAQEDCCATCSCPPMWCVECLAKWFVSRQKSSEKQVWLEKKATCPMCRSKFCLLDVCFLESSET